MRLREEEIAGDSAASDFFVFVDISSLRAAPVQTSRQIIVACEASVHTRYSVLVRMGSVRCLTITPASSKILAGEQKAKIGDGLLSYSAPYSVSQKLSALRSELEAALAGRIPAPFAVRDRQLFQMASTGISEIDFLAGGLPRGGLTEIYGPFCSGRTSLLLSALASRTTTGEACALVDGCDAFDPHSAEAAGVKLKKLLWVRCRNLDHALRATDLLLQGGGFSLIALDLSDIFWKTIRHVPLNVWFRLRRAVENTPTILVLLNRESQAKTCASLVLRLEAAPACRITMPEICDPLFFRHAVSCLFDGFEVHVERIRSRVQSVTDASGARSTGRGFHLEPARIKSPPEFCGHSTAPVIADGRTSTFRTRAFWNYFSRDAFRAVRP